ncbi:MAG TPA: radical SAM family heme chaperone HemW [Candidatus Polarisedimenticolaceae bacterium]|nr:radical SAM family heme chaperone HemW [Candidatus Polarisedimenticolaceae bacterium]
MPPSGSDRGAPPPAAPLGIYAHFPFCSVRCTYCDFPTVAGRDDRIEAYLRALLEEIASHQPDARGAADTVFLGGGTPSRMTAAQTARLLEAIAERFDVADDAEITLEGNPESLTADALQGFRHAGVTRISVGVQSLDDAVLARAGRAHDAADARRAVADARAAGFPDVSVDLIAGLPGEDVASWARTVARVAGWEPDHVSVYLLESDKETPLGRGVRSGRVRIPDDDALAAMYETTVEALERAGYPLYEISNFSRSGHRSRHNLKYWTDAPYAGFGLGAHGYVAGERRSNRRDLDGYLSDLAAGRSPRSWTEAFDRARRLEEALFLGLRVAEGVDLAALARRYGLDPRTVYAAAWERAEAAGLIALEEDRVRLTPSGRVRSNELFAELIGDEAPSPARPL